MSVAMGKINVALPLAVAAAIMLLSAGGFAAAWFSAAPVMAEETFTVVEHPDSDTVIDLADEGDTIGDSLAFSNEIYDADDANVVGTSQGSCVRTAPGAAWECTWTNTLDNGSIVVQGPFYDAKDSVLAITGGTGDYAGASGEMELKARDDGKFDFVFTIE